MKKKIVKNNLDRTKFSQIVAYKDYEKWIHRIGLVLALVFIFSLISRLSVASVDKNQLENAVDLQKTNLSAAKESQGRVDKTYEETQELKARYRQALQSIENTKIYNQQLREVIESQKQEKELIDQEIVNIKETTQKVSPLMTRMKESLSEFVKSDLPFLSKERNKRIKDLDKLFVQSGVSLSEKYRKVLEAYLIENEYGTTIESYSDALKINGQEQTVDFLKVGRVGLYYLAKDKKKAGVWSLEKSDWLDLNSAEKAAVEQAIKVATKQAAPSLLTLPIIKSSASVATKESL